MAEATEDHVGLVYHVAQRLAQNAGQWSDYDEMVGDGMEALVRATHTWDGTGRFAAYAYRRIRWRIIDAYRQRHGRPTRPDTAQVDDVPPPTTPSAETIALAQLGLDEALATLSPRLRAVAEASLEPGGQRRLARAWGLSESRITQLRREAYQLLAQHYRDVEAA